VSVETLLSVKLTIDYPGKPAVLRNASLEMRRGEVLGVVGQSGSGKSTLALSIMRLLDIKGGRVTGNITLQGCDLLALREGEMRRRRGREVALVLQSPISSLNPAMRIGAQMQEAWRAHATTNGDECRAAIADALRNVSLPSDDAFLRRKPAQLSVGQAQRVLIAMAILHKPTLLIADEPTSALDVITQAEVLALFRKLNEEAGVSILYISHDLGSVASICDRLAILHEGEFVECAETQQIIEAPAHAYTQRLIAAAATNLINRKSALSAKA
jgi:ABC-type glutathione transport system ATPase component